MDEAERTVNQALLPWLLRFCEEYYSVKAYDWLAVQPSQTEAVTIDDDTVSALRKAPRILCLCGHASVWHKGCANLRQEKQKRMVSRQPVSRDATNRRF